MADHTAQIDWQRGDEPFSHEGFPKAHTVKFANGHAVESSAAPDYQGDADRVDPESMLVGALSSCHMLTFLTLAAKKRLVVETYRDHALGQLGKNEAGRMAVTQITLRPAVTFGGPPEQQPDADTIAAMHKKSHDYCFIANSVSCAVHVEPAL